MLPRFLSRDLGETYYCSPHFIFYLDIGINDTLETPNQGQARPPSVTGTVLLPRAESYPRAAARLRPCAVTSTTKLTFPHHTVESAQHIYSHTTHNEVGRVMRGRIGLITDTMQQISDSQGLPATRAVSIAVASSPGRRSTRCPWWKPDNASIYKNIQVHVCSRLSQDTTKSLHYDGAMEPKP